MPNHRNKFQQIFQFNQQDLKTNENGQLTRRQRYLLFWLSLKQDKAILWVLIYWIITLPVSLIDSGALVVFTVPVFLLIIWKFSKVLIDVLNGRVLEADGEVFIRESKYQTLARRMGPNQGYGMSIDYVGFQITQATYHAFQNGKRYRVYYTPFAKIIVSAEKAFSHKE